MTVSTRITPVLRLALFTLVLAAGALSCGGDKSTGPGGGNPVTLSISLSASSALPAQQVDIQGVPSGMDVTSLYAEITAPSGAQYGSLMGRREDGSVYMVAPLNADAPVDGGEVTVQVTNGDNVTSNHVSLTVRPLPPATITLDEIISRMQALMDSRMTAQGRTREELRATAPESMAPIDYPLFMAQDILDSPDNPNSLRATVDGPVPFFENATIDFDLANRLLSLIPIREFLDEEVASVDSMVAEPDTAGAVLEGIPPRTGIRSAVAPLQGCIDMGDAGITSALLLHRAMGLSRFSKRRLDGASGKVVSDVAAAFTALAVVPEPDAKAAAKAIGGVVYVYKLLNEASSNLLPSDFDNSATTFTPQPDTLPEDEILGFWNEFKVTAVSDGWEMDADILRALLKVAKFTDLGGVRNFIGGPDPELSKNLGSYLVGEAVKGLIDKVTGGQDIIRVCPGRWPNIDCTFPQWSKPTIISGTSIAFTEEHNGYRPVEAGISQLRVETRPDKFGGALAFEIKPIEVKRIRVVVTPDYAQAEVNEILSFDIRVENANDTRYNWVIPEGFSFVDWVDNTLVIQAPPDPWEPVNLRIHSLSFTGAREGKVDSDPRDGFATITNGNVVQIHIEPSYKCIGNNETLDFTPTVVGIENYTVIWKVAEGWGQIDQNGRYTAPPGGTTDDLISAEVEGYPQAIDYARVRVGACTCSYSIDIVGASFFHEDGGDVAYLFSDLPDGFHTFTFFFMLDTDATGFSLSLGPAGGVPGPRPGDTGVFEAGASYIAPGGGASWTTADSTATLFVEILEHTDTYMVGNFSGTLVGGDGQNRTSVLATGSFRAGAWTGSWPCE